MSHRLGYFWVAGATVVVIAGLIAGCSGSSNDSPTAPPDPFVNTNVNNSSDSSSGTNQVEFASIVIEKATNGVDADFAPGPSIPIGNDITWTYRITNNGNESLTNIVASDAPEGPIACPLSTLEPQESMDCDPKLGTAIEGQYSNTATVTGDSASGQATASDDSHYLGTTGDVQIALDLEKQTNGEDADSPMGPIVLVGDPVTWSYLVTNNSEEQATNIIVTDDQEGPVICPSDTLAVGDEMICDSISGTAEPGQYSNEGELTAVVSGTDVTVTDLSHYFGSDPHVVLDKLTNGQDGPFLIIDCPVTWTYEVTNDGNIDLEQIVVSDDPIGLITCPRTSLIAGESMTCEFSGTVVAGDYDNLGSVTAYDPIGTEVEADDLSSYFGTEQCSNVVPSDDSLWPPNHRLVTVDLLGDVCGGDVASFTITGVTQDEPVNGLGDGDTSPDAVIADDGSSVELRRERAGGGNGRVYEISYEAENGDGVGCAGSVFVGVPHDQGGSPPFDDGQAYDSTLP